MSLTDLSKENLQVVSKPEKVPSSRQALQDISTVPKAVFHPVSTLHFAYANEILSTLFKEESQYKLPVKFLKSQKDINSKMRSILIDWIVTVHKRFKLLPETLFLTVKITDRFLYFYETSRKDLQLVGITSLFLASKYEEIYPPELRDLILLTDKAYSKDQALIMERLILKTLNFQITMPSSWRFFEKFSEKLLEQEKSMGHYLLELCLVDDIMTKFSESLIAITAVYLAGKIFSKEVAFDSEHYAEEEIKKCAVEMMTLFQIASNHPLTAVRDKFSKPQFHQVSTIFLE